MRTSAICSAPLHESSVACQVEAVSSIPKPNPWNSDEPFSYKQMWFGATFNKGTSQWTFPSAAILEFGFLDADENKFRCPK